MSNPLKNHALRRWGRVAAVWAVVTTVLSSCYLPNDFVTEIRINRYGDYAMTYVGNLVYAPLYEDALANRLTPAEMREKVDVLMRDLQRDTTYDRTGRTPSRPLFTEIEHQGSGRFKVRYEREGSLDASALVTFIRRNNNILSLHSREGAITIRANALSATDSQRVMALGLSMKGEMRVVTDAQVLEHNANTVRNYAGYLVYIWTIDNVLAPAPKIVLKQEPRSGS